MTLYEIAIRVAGILYELPSKVELRLEGLVDEFARDPKMWEAFSGHVANRRLQLSADEEAG